MAMLVEDSSTKIRRSGSTPSRRSLKALLLRSSRSVAPSVFVVGPPQLHSDRPAHGGQRHPNARLSLPQLAVLCEGRLDILFELAPQGALLLGGGKDTPPSSRGGLGL